MRLLQRFACALFLAASAQAASYQDAVQSPEGTADRILALLEKPLPVEDLVRACVELGPEAIPALFEGLAKDRITPDAERLAVVERRALALTLQRMPRPRVLHFLGTLDPAEMTLSERVTGLRVLGSLADPGGLDLVLRFTVRGDGRLESALESGFESAIRSLIERHPDGLAIVVGRFADLPRACLAGVVTEISPAGREGPFEGLGRDSGSR